MEELKPCPFCGGEAKTLVEYDKVGGGEFSMSAYVKCSICGVYKRIRFDASNAEFRHYTNAFENAVSSWNTRCEG